MSIKIKHPPGHHMKTEAAQAAQVFAATVLSAGFSGRGLDDIAGLRALYTVARGSSDAAANILSYEFMAQLGIPVTSLPPSVFSLGKGVDLTGAGVMVISQSGASDDLVNSARGASRLGAYVVALTNVPGSDVEKAADVTIPIAAGVERAVPATKTVIGSIAAGMALLAAIKPGYRAACETAARAFRANCINDAHPLGELLAQGLIEADNVYVIGRGAGFGAAHEVALKLKETCALHAEAYSASEVLHGPLQLVTKPLTVLILDTGEAATQDSLNTAENRFSQAGAKVFRIKASEMCASGLTPAGAAALLLYLCYPIIQNVALTLGFDPDSPDKLAKVTRTT
jgi:glutamine---fructose-6-phosphate transaminase (isomerizing)